MIFKTISWILHWFGQGLKLYLFALVAALVGLPFLGLGAVIGHFVQLTGLDPTLVQWISLGGGFISAVLSIAVFTAVLANQLTAQPLKNYSPRVVEENDVPEPTANAAIETR